MKYNQAKQELENVLNNQKTVEVSKLKELMQSLNLSLEPSKDKEVKFLRDEVRKLNQDVRKIKEWVG